VLRLYAMNAAGGRDLTNVIAQGGTAGVEDISVVTDIGGHAKVTVTHSNFEHLGGGGGNGEIVDGGGNQHDPPKFLDPATGDYRQAPGSVTINAGIDQPVNGAFARLARMVPPPRVTPCASAS